MKWIKTTDKMPEQLIPVLVYISDQAHINTAVWEDGIGWYETYESIIIHGEVSHWMPLPIKPGGRTK
jgi:hypothetical protein